MDERQTQIRQGAGLEESRVNREFVDWLSRWSTPILLVFLVLAATYVIYQRVQQGRVETVNRAFMELELATATQNPNPRVLEDIARTYRNIRAVPHIANLLAADEYLRAARLNVAPGTQISPDGTVEEEDVLNEEQRQRYLAEAERLYSHVLGTTQNERHKGIHAISAAYGLAAISETRGDLEAARGHYQRVIEIAERTGFRHQVAIARHRLENVDRLAELPRLYASAELPQLPGMDEPGEPTGMEIPGMELPTFQFDGGMETPDFFDPGPEQELPGQLEVPGTEPGEGQSPADPG